AQANAIATRNVLNSIIGRGFEAIPDPRIVNPLLETVDEAVAPLWVAVTAVYIADTAIAQFIVVGDITELQEKPHSLVANAALRLVRSLDQLRVTSDKNRVLGSKLIGTRTALEDAREQLLGVLRKRIQLGSQPRNLRKEFHYVDPSH